MMKKTIIRLFWVTVLLLLSDVILCRRTYYIPEAGVFVKQVPKWREEFVDNYFSCSLFPLLLNITGSLDMVRMDHLTEMGVIIVFDPGKKMIYLDGESFNGDYDRIRSFSEKNLRIEVIESGFEDMYYSHSNHKPLEPFPLIMNTCWLGQLSFFVIPAHKAHKAHLYHLYLFPVYGGQHSRK